VSLAVMLRKTGDYVQIGPDIRVRLSEGSRVVLAIDAPRAVPITRSDQSAKAQRFAYWRAKVRAQGQK